MANLRGWMSKGQVFVARFPTGNAWAMGLVLSAALHSVLSLGYYAPLVNRMYRHEASAVVKRGAQVPLLIALPLALLAALVIVLGVWSSLVSWLTEPAGKILAGAF